MRLIAMGKVCRESSRLIAVGEKSHSPETWGGGGGGDESNTLPL